MDTTRRTRRSYDAIAGAYRAQLGDELVGKPLDRALLGAAVEAAGDGVLLDAGCGPAHVAAHLASRGARVLGVDLSPGMVAAAPPGLPVAAGDLTALPIATGAVAGVVCLYAVIHLDADARAAAYRELARVLRPGGQLLLAFHVRDARAAPGTSVEVDDLLQAPVELTFHYLDPEAETRRLAAAGLDVVARLDRSAHPGLEHASERCYLVAQPA